MQYTKNYHLPQWVKEDRIMMEDFNAMNSSIEAGLNTAVGKADTAISTANNASETAQSASAAALACSYVVGTYTGDGTTQEINLGFRPRFVIISGIVETNTTHALDQLMQSCVFTAGKNAVQNRCVLTATGFRVYQRATNLMGYPALTEEGRVYDYIAFR